jgi:Mrp family chromosome partitioning ATPase
MKPTMLDYQAAAAWVLKRLDDAPAITIAEKISDGQIIVFKPQALPSILTATGLHLLKGATHD